MNIPARKLDPVYFQSTRQFLRLMQSEYPFFVRDSVAFFIKSEAHVEYWCSLAKILKNDHLT
jgi:hypothetical protein